MAVALIALARRAEATAHAVAPQQARIVTFQRGVSLAGDENGAHGRRDSLPNILIEG